MENEVVNEKKYPFSFKAADVYKDKVIFYNYEKLNFFGTAKERREIEKKAQKDPSYIYFKGVSHLKFRRVFSTAKVYVYYLDKKDKTRVFKYNCRGVKLGTNLGSVLLNLSVDTANGAIRAYRYAHNREEDK